MSGLLAVKVKLFKVRTTTPHPPQRPRRKTMKSIDPLTIMAACVNTMLQFFIILAAFQSTTPPVHLFLPPIDILEEMIGQTADLYNVKGLKRVHLVSLVQ